MAERSPVGEIAHGIYRIFRWIARHIRGRVVRRVGGTARARVIAIFGLVLAVNGADQATVGAIAPQLEASLHISTTKIGLLSSVTLVIGAIATIPIGLLVDRVKRIPILSISIVLWSLASLASAFASSYSSLLITRLILGAVVATAGPAIASLTGDYFPSRERGRIYAYILGGEIAGNAIGFIVSGSVANAIDWRAAFVVLAIPGFFLARSLYRTVPEPLRGGQSQLEHGVEDLVEAAAAARAGRRARGARGSGSTRAGGAADYDDQWLRDETDHRQPEDLAHAAARRLGVLPDPDLVLEDDPRTLGLLDSIRYVMAIRTNVYMIISSSLGYFYFSGLSTFALLYVRGHFHVGQTTSEMVLAVLVGGAMVGTLVAGWLSDVLMKRGFLNGRVWLPALSYLLAAVLLIPGFLTNSLGTAMLFDTLGAALVCAANPPLDAARLDIMPAGLWGRAESVRTFLRSLSQAAAPLVFGGLADLIGGFYPKQAVIGTNPGPVSSQTAHGLEITFLILLAALALGGVAMLRARFTYARDVATAGASNQGSVEPSVMSWDTRSHRVPRPVSNQPSQPRPPRRRTSAGRDVGDVRDPPEWGSAPRSKEPPEWGSAPSDEDPPEWGGRPRR